MTSGEMYLGELNPRVTGASSMTNVTAVAYGDMPLFLFHLLEFMDVDYEIDVDELNDGWAQPGAIDEWSQFILKDTADKVELIMEAPQLGDLAARPGRPRRHPLPCAATTDWHTVASEDEAFYLRIAQKGGYRYPGADIGILVTRGRLQTDEHELTDRARAWIDGIKRQFATAPLPASGPVPVREPEPFSFKLLWSLRTSSLHGARVSRCSQTVASSGTMPRCRRRSPSRRSSNSSPVTAGGRCSSATGRATRSGS